jgi:oligoribonuclease
MEKLLWIDMEMTGLDVQREVIIEVAAIATSLDLIESASYHAVVKQPASFLEKMDAWNKKHHGDSGLTALIPNGKEPSVVEDELMKFVAEHFQQPPVIAGNSISQDRAFINKYFPRLNSKLHYRMLDVTSWKIIMTARYGVKYEKKNAHRAVDDIRESIAELAHYLNYVSPKPAPSQG